jgi:uncharacterized protein (TIGR03067 family)
MRPLLALALLVSLASAAPVPKAVKKQNDAEQIVGSWKPVEGQTDWFEFTADGKMLTWDTGGSAGTGPPFTYTLDTTTDPKSMTWGDRNKTPLWDCVYELDGDTLRISYNRDGKRPTKVEAARGQHFCDPPPRHLRQVTAGVS